MKSLDSREAGETQDEEYHRNAVFTVKWFAALYLIAGNHEEVSNGIVEADRLLTLYGDDLPYHARSSIPHAIDVLLGNKEKRAKGLVCRIAKLTDANRDNIDHIKRLFLSGCEQALDHMIKQLDRSDLSGTASYTENGVTRTSETCAADYFAEQLGNAHWRPANKEGNDQSREWYPSGFWYDSLDSVQEKVEKREQLKAWLRKKFDGISKRSSS